VWRRSWGGFLLVLGVGNRRVFDDFSFVFGGEEGQNFAFLKHFKEPESIPHLGLTGWWFPREQQMQTTDGRILITVTVVNWPQHGHRPRTALSAAVARTYLGPLLRGARLVGD
jgi:hypothetical protein